MNCSQIASHTRFNEIVDDLYNVYDVVDRVDDPQIEKLILISRLLRLFYSLLMNRQFSLTVYEVFVRFRETDARKGWGGGNLGKWLGMCHWPPRPLPYYSLFCSQS